MKKQLFGLSVLVTCLSASALAAGPVANIQVSGDIKPPTCTVNGLEQNDVIFDYGRIGLGLLKESQSYSLGRTEDKDILIQCDAQTYLTFTATSPYPSTTVTDPAVLDLVDVADTSKRVGGYNFAVRVSETTVDNQPATLSNTLTNSSAILINGNVKGVTKTAKNNTPVDEWDLIPGEEFKLAVYGGYSYRSISSKNILRNNGVNVTDGFDFTTELVMTFNFGV